MTIQGNCKAAGCRTWVASFTGYCGEHEQEMVLEHASLRARAEKAEAELHGVQERVRLALAAMGEHMAATNARAEKAEAALVAVKESADDTRASAVRYARAMAEKLYADAREQGAFLERAANLRRDGAMAESMADDIEQRLDLDPERLQELGVTP